MPTGVGIGVLLEQNGIVKLLNSFFFYLLTFTLALLSFTLPTFTLDLFFTLPLDLLLSAFPTFLLGLFCPQFIIRIHAESGMLNFLLGCLYEW